MSLNTSLLLRPLHAENPGITAVRIAVATTMFIHGTYRTAVGAVAAFGGFFDSLGLPAGLALAWILTAAEIAGALLLLARRAIVPVSAWFIVELATGVALVHWSRGWFVVGGGTGGMEFSFLIISCFAALILSEVQALRET